MLSRGLNGSLSMHSEVSTSLWCVTEKAAFCFVLCTVSRQQYTFAVLGMSIEHLPYAKHHAKWREEGYRD